MAADLYDLGRQGSEDHSIDLLADNIKAVLVSAGYVRNLATDQFLSIITAGQRLGTTANLAGKTVVLGAFNAANTLFPAVPAGVNGTQVVLYKDTGLDTTSRLIANWDFSTGLPVTPNGSDIQLLWDAGANKIFNWLRAN